MPQLDKVSWFSQIFWLLVVFFIFYFLMVRFILPTLASSLKLRAKILSGVVAQNIQRGDVKNDFYIKLVKNSFSGYFLLGDQFKAEVTSFVSHLNLFLRESIIVKKLIDTSSSFLVRVRIAQENLKKNA